MSIINPDENTLAVRSKQCDRSASFVSRTLYHVFPEIQGCGKELSNGKQWRAVSNCDSFHWVDSERTEPSGKRPMNVCRHSQLFQALLGGCPLRKKQQKMSLLFRHYPNCHNHAGLMATIVSQPVLGCMTRFKNLLVWAWFRDLSDPTVPFATSVTGCRFSRNQR